MPDAVERMTLAISAFVASLLLFPLGGRISSVAQLFRDRVAALSALALAAMLLAFHVVMSRREARSAPPPARAAEPPSGAIPSATTPGDPPRPSAPS